MSEKPDTNFEEIVRRDGRYPPEAFVFLRDGLNRAAGQIHGEQAKDEGPHHVTGRQLCRALRDEAVERWGLLAGTVLGRWNIRATIDFGNMVYLLIENDLMRKTEEDSLEDFRDVYDFDKAFGSDEIFEGDN